MYQLCPQVDPVCSDSLKSQVDHDAKESHWNGFRRSVEGYVLLRVLWRSYIRSGGATYDAFFVVISMYFFAANFGSYCGQINTSSRAPAEHARTPILPLLCQALAVLVTAFSEHRSVCKVSDWPMIAFVALHLFTFVFKNIMIKRLELLLGLTLLIISYTRAMQSVILKVCKSIENSGTKALGVQDFFW